MADYLSRPATAPADIERTDPIYEVTDAGNSSMKVVVRVRPESEAELRSSCQCVVRVLDEHVLVFDPAGHQTTGVTSSTVDTENKKPFAFTSPGVSRFFGGRRLRPLLSKKHKDLRFAFDRVFDETSSQTEVFHHTAHSIIDGVLDGINSSVFAYGATGAGKTYTMLGHPEDPGVIFLTMMELYRRIDAIKSSKTCRISVSYCEVYNETIRDLLEPSGPLSLREDSQKGLVVSGLTCHSPETADEILTMLERGNGNRTQHPTEVNATSSRSHAVFQVFVEQRPRTANLSTEVTQAKMSLIDLAGSERATVTSNKGARLREGANINRSLLALGNCINALASNKGKGGYVPYRDSKLTRLLKDSLGGNCRTVMVANISPSALSYEDSYNTLKYADRAKQIKTSLVRNVLQVDYHMTKYKAIIMELRKEIAELKGAVNTSSKERTFDPKEADRLCDLVGGVYGERGRLRKHMAELDAKEREALLKVCRKERDLNRIEMLSANELKKAKIKGRLEALRRHVTDIQRQKQTVNEYLYSNNESVSRIQGEINAACRVEHGGSGLGKLMEAVTDARKLEVENGHQWKQTKHLLKYIKNQEREIAKTERILSLSLSLVRRQQCLLKASNSTLTKSIQEDLDSLTHLADGDKGVAWADQTRLSTNELCDVNTSIFSLTQQDLFDSFLEHSSPRVRGGFPRGVHSPSSPHLLSNSLGILTHNLLGSGSGSNGEESDKTVTPPALSRESSRGTPTPRTSSSTLTVRSSHTISNHASTHTNDDVAQSAPGSVTVTTDVCFSSAKVHLDDKDDLSEVSSSGVGSYTASEPSPSDIDYEKKLMATAADIRNHKPLGRSRTPAFDFSKKPHPPVKPSPQAIYQRRPVGSQFFSKDQCKLPSPPSSGTPGFSHVAPQPYSLFKPFNRPARNPPPPPMSRPPPLGAALSSFPSVHSVSADSGIGNMCSIPRGRGSVLIPNRPMANGFMVRSSPSSNSYYNSVRFNAFEDNFVSPRRSSVGHMTCHRTNVPKIPAGAANSPFSARVTATPNPYVKAPSLSTRPSPRTPHTYESITVPTTASASVPTQTNRSTNTAQHSSESPRSEGHVTGTISTPPPSRKHRVSFSECTSLAGSRTNLTSESQESSQSHALNSTFTVEMGVTKVTADQVSSGSSQQPSDGKGETKALGQGGKKQQGRGMFSRGKSPGKLPSYLRMTKSSESKKVNRVQNKENQGQPPPSSGVGLRFKRFNADRSHDHINAKSGPSIALTTRYNSAPQLAW